jgi:hypothetical protein
MNKIAVRTGTAAASTGSELGPLMVPGHGSGSPKMKKGKSVPNLNQVRAC